MNCIKRMYCDGDHNNEHRHASKQALNSCWISLESKQNFFCIKTNKMLLNKDVLRVIKSSLKSRLIVLSCGVVFNWIIDDHKADAFRNRFQSDDGLKWTQSASDLIILKLLSGTTRWDSQYFLIISHDSYSEEEFLAFFPFFPLLVRFLASILFYFWSHFVSFYCTLILSAVLINLLSFILTSIVLYKLTLEMFNDKKFAMNAIHWFCYNPASIFFTVSYSESLFSFLTFTALWFCHNKRLLMASIFIGLSSATRSNGILI